MHVDTTTQAPGGVVMGATCTTPVGGAALSQTICPALDGTVPGGTSIAALLQAANQTTGTLGGGIAGVTTGTPVGGNAVAITCAPAGETALAATGTQ